MHVEQQREEKQQDRKNNIRVETGAGRQIKRGEQNRLGSHQLILQEVHAQQHVYNATALPCSY